MSEYKHPTPEDFGSLGFAAGHDAYRRLYDEWTRRMALDAKGVPRFTRAKIRREAYDEILGKVEDFAGAIRSVARRRA